VIICRTLSGAVIFAVKFTVSPVFAQLSVRRGSIDVNAAKGQSSVDGNRGFGFRDHSTERKILWLEGEPRGDRRSGEMLGGTARKRPSQVSCSTNLVMTESFSRERVALVLVRTLIVVVRHVTVALVDWSLMSSRSGLEKWEVIDDRPGAPSGRAMSRPGIEVAAAVSIMSTAPNSSSSTTRSWMVPDKRVSFSTYWKQQGD
jgi:hypothetical protein